MFKVTGLLVFFVASYVLWFIRKSKARTRLQEIDDGKRCVACDGTSLESFGGNARCLRCGHVVSLVGLQAAVVSERELSDITKPDNRTD